LRTYCLHCHAHHLDLHSFPTRRSSDLTNILERAIVETPVARPSSPSIKLIAFVIPTIQNNVKTIPKTPKSIIPKKGSVTRSMTRSEEHTSELQSRFDLVCRLLLEKKNT